MVLSSKPTNVKINSSFQGSLPVTWVWNPCCRIQVSLHAKSQMCNHPCGILRLHVSFPLCLYYPFFCCNVRNNNQEYIRMDSAWQEMACVFRAGKCEVTNRLFISDELAELAPAHFKALGCTHFETQMVTWVRKIAFLATTSQHHLCQPKPPLTTAGCLMACSTKRYQFAAQVHRMKKRQQVLTLWEAYPARQSWDPLRIGFHRIPRLTVAPLRGKGS